MYQRFTDRARKVMMLANQEAQRLNHGYVGTEHILLGLIKENSGVAAHVLKGMGLDLHKIRLEAEKLVQPGPDMIIFGKLPLTPMANEVIEYSVESADELNDHYVGTEHILLGLLKQKQGVSASVLANLRLSENQIRDEVLNLLGRKPIPGVEVQAVAEALKDSEEGWKEIVDSVKLEINSMVARRIMQEQQDVGFLANLDQTKNQESQMKQLKMN